MGFYKPRARYWRLIRHRRSHGGAARGGRLQGRSKAIPSRSTTSCAQGASGSRSSSQKVLIHAGSGGVGTFAIQLAKHVGAVVATTTSTANRGWVKALGADIVVDYSKEDFATILRDYDVVLNSLGGEVLEKSLQVLKPGGKLISISGPPDPDFAKEMGASWILRQVMRLLSHRIRKKAKRHRVSYSFLFHESERRPVARNRFPHRFCVNSASCGSGLCVRIDQRGYGLLRNRTCKRQGRRQGKIEKWPCFNRS